MWTSVIHRLLLGDDTWRTFSRCRRATGISKRSTTVENTEYLHRYFLAANFRTLQGTRDSPNGAWHGKRGDAWHMLGTLELVSVTT